MSNDEKEKISETENKIENAVEQAEEVVKDVVDQAEEIMDDAVETVSEGTENIVSKVMALKESNPKVLYGGIGALVIVIFGLMMMGGGDKPPLPVAKAINLAIGQTYALKGVNTYDPDATVRLVAVPGSIAAYDDTEEEDREGECKHMPQGTKVKVSQIQEAFGKAKFVEVEMIDGECAGKKGWTVSNNLD
ncbi:MAG: hypothetical protein L3J59_06365 [Methylococcaceae bacterium]|nr:hypothetical protein [Methylococcaceae bacterium]